MRFRRSIISNLLKSNEFTIGGRSADSFNTAEASYSQLRMLDGLRGVEVSFIRESSTEDPNLLVSGLKKFLSHLLCQDYFVDIAHFEIEGFAELFSKLRSKKLQLKIDSQNQTVLDFQEHAISESHTIYTLLTDPMEDFNYDKICFDSNRSFMLMNSERRIDLKEIEFFNIAKRSLDNSGLSSLDYLDIVTKLCHKGYTIGRFSMDGNTYASFQLFIHQYFLEELVQVLNEVQKNTGDQSYLSCS